MFLLHKSKQTLIDSQHWLIRLKYDTVPCVCVWICCIYGAAAGHAGADSRGFGCTCRKSKRPRYHYQKLMELSHPPAVSGIRLWLLFALPCWWLCGLYFGHVTQVVIQVVRPSSFSSFKQNFSGIWIFFFFLLAAVIMRKLFSECQKDLRAAVFADISQCVCLEMKAFTEQYWSTTVNTNTVEIVLLNFKIMWPFCSCTTFFSPEYKWEY